VAWKTLVGCLAIGAMLSGCLSPNEMREKRRAKNKATDIATCKSFGFEVDKPEYKQCIVNEQRYRQTQHDIDVNRMKARRAQRQQRYGY